MQSGVAHCVLMVQHFTMTYDSFCMLPPPQYLDEMVNLVCPFQQMRLHSSCLGSFLTEEDLTQHMVTRHVMCVMCNPGRLVSGSRPIFFSSTASPLYASHVAGCESSPPITNATVQTAGGIGFWAGAAQQRSSRAPLLTGANFPSLGRSPDPPRPASAPRPSPAEVAAGGSTPPGRRRQRYRLMTAQDMSGSVAAPDSVAPGHSPGVTPSSIQGPIDSSRRPPAVSIPTSQVGLIFFFTGCAYGLCVDIPSGYGTWVPGSIDSFVF